MQDRDWQAEIALLQERERKAYAILGSPETSSRREIKRAFRRACLVCHPDKKRQDKDAKRRFHLICCAYKLLTEGYVCPELDEAESPAQELTAGKYRFDNPWGYFAWWRESFFDFNLQRKG